MNIDYDTVMTEVANSLDPEILRTIVSLQSDERFTKFYEHLNTMLEKSRIDLESADQRFRQTQGRVEAIREILGLIDGAKTFLSYQLEGKSA